MQKFPTIELMEGVMKDMSDEIQIEHIRVREAAKKIFFSGLTTKTKGVWGGPLRKNELFLKCFFLICSRLKIEYKTTYPNINISVLCCRSAKSQSLTGF